MIRTIPLRAGAPFQRFRVNLGGTTLRIRLYWSERFRMFSADIYRGSEAIIRGRGLHPGIDLLNGLNLGIGRLYLDGAEPTVTNLGIDNRLRHES